MIFGINRYSIKSSQMPLLIPVLLSVSIIPTGSVFATGFVDGIKVKPYTCRQERPFTVWLINTI